MSPSLTTTYFFVLAKEPRPIEQDLNVMSGLESVSADAPLSDQTLEAAIHVFLNPTRRACVSAAVFDSLAIAFVRLERLGNLSHLYHSLAFK